jgi:hypothetical protein
LRLGSELYAKQYVSDIVLEPHVECHGLRTSRE